MKYILFIFALCLLTSTFATSSKARTFASLKKINHSLFGKTIIDTVQMELKSSSKADPRPRIQQLLHEILDETRDAIKNLNDNIALERASCESVQTQLTDSISSLEAQVDADTAETGSQSQKLSTLHDEVNIRNNLLDNYNAELAGARQSRANNQKLFEERDRRFRRILEVLDKTLQFITERLENRNSAGFLQRNNVLLEVKRTVESPEFMKIAGGWGKFVSFLATKALHRMKQTPDEAAVAGLEEVVRVIRDVIASVNSDVSENNSNNEADRAAFQAEENRLENTIATVSAEVACLEGQIANTESRLRELASAIETNSALIVSQTESLAQSRAGCKAAEEAYAATLAERNGEVEVIEEVIRILTEDLSNLRGFTEDTIGASSIDVNA